MCHPNIFLYKIVGFGCGCVFLFLGGEPGEEVPGDPGDLSLCWRWHYAFHQDGEAFFIRHSLCSQGGAIPTVGTLSEHPCGGPSRRAWRTSSIREEIVARV